MNKLAGVEPAADETPDRDADAAVKATTQERVPADQQPGPSASSAPSQVVDPEGEETAPTAAPIPHPAPSAEQPRPSGNPEGEAPFVHIDFAKLRAAGNLTPDAEFGRVAEEYQYIKRRLLGNVALNAGQAGRPANLIMVTSSVPGEGKTFTSTNLAMSMSIERDHTILLVDTDIMKRDLSRQFGLSDAPGLYDYLDHQFDDIAQVIYRTSLPNMVIIPAGRYTHVSTELLASARMQTLVGEFAARYSDRIVLFDTPPLLATTTAVALAPLVGQLVLVVEAGETRTNIVEDALRTLDRAQVTGLVLNKSKGSTLQTYDYYGYYHPQAEHPA